MLLLLLLFQTIIIFIKCHSAFLDSNLLPTIRLVTVSSISCSRKQVKRETGQAAWYRSKVGRKNFDWRTYKPVNYRVSALKGVQGRDKRGIKGWNKIIYFILQLK